MAQKKYIDFSGFYRPDYQGVALGFDDFAIGFEQYVDIIAVEIFQQFIDFNSDLAKSGGKACASRSAA